MHAQIHTIAFWGIETIAVTVQIHITNGLPAMAIVRLADKAVAILAIERVPCSRAPACGPRSASNSNGPDEFIGARLS